MEGSGPSALMSYLYSLFAFAMGFSFGPDLRELHEASSVSSLLGRYGLQIVAAAILFGAASAAGVVRLLKERRAALYICVLASIFGLVAVAAILRIKVLNARYLMCAFPVFIAIVAYGIPRGRLTGIAAGSVLVLIMLFSVSNYHFVPRYARDDMRGAVRIISEDARPGDLILAPGMARAVRYYYEGKRPVESVYAAHLDREGIDRKLHGMTEGRRRVWLLSSRPWDTDAGGHIVAWFGSGTVLLAEYELPGISLRLYEMAPGDIDTP